MVLVIVDKLYWVSINGLGVVDVSVFLSRHFGRQNVMSKKGLPFIETLFLLSDGPFQYISDLVSISINILP